MMNSQVLIRHATQSDTARIKDIIDSSFPRFFRFFASHSVDSEEGHLLLSEYDGKVAGFAKLIDFQVGGVKYGCILWIAVHPTYRQQGIALNLVKAGIDYLKQYSANAVFASTQRRNKAAQATLCGAGFVRVGFWGLRRRFGWRVLGFYRAIWYAPGELVYMCY